MPSSIRSTLLTGAFLSVLVLATGADSAVAQPRRLGVIGFGAFSRLGSVPEAFEPGIPVVLEATVQWPLFGALQLATSADLTVQRMGTALSISSLIPGQDGIVRRPYAFDVVHVSAGPAFAQQVTRRMLLSGSLQASILVPSWGSSSVGVCGGNCAVLEPGASSQQTEVHTGTVARIRLTYGERKERIGFELLGILGPRHSRSRLPLTSVALLIVVGAS